MKDDNTKMLDSQILPPDLAAEWRALDDVEPDTIDIPEASEASWATAQRGPGARERILAALGTVHLERDVLHWLMRQGEDVQATANRILRDHMTAHR